MATGLTSNIRLVKCPRCRRLLPELPDIPVYKCGGCDAILVAKIRTDGSHNTGLGSQNRDSVQRHEIHPPSDDKQPSTSNHEAIIPSQDLNNGRHTNESGERSSEELVHSTLSVQQRNDRNDDESQQESDDMLDGDKAEEASISSSSHEAIIPSSGECIVDPNVEEDEDKSGDSSSEQLVRRKVAERRTCARNNDESHMGLGGSSGFPNQVYCEEKCAYYVNGELPCRDAPEQEEYSISSPETIIPSSGECIIDPIDVKSQKESGDVSQEQLSLIKSSECLTNLGSNDESRACYLEQQSCSNQSSPRIEFPPHWNADLSIRNPIKATESSTSSQAVVTIPFSAESVLEPNDERDQKEEQENHSERLNQISLSEHQKNASIDDESPASHGEQSESSVQASFVNEVANDENDKLSSVASLEDEIIEEVLLSGVESPEVDDRMEIHLNSESSGILIAVATNSTIPLDTRAGTNIPSKILAPVTERVAEHEETINHHSNHQILVDDFDCVEVNPCAEPSRALPRMIKSLTTGGSFAYDGSISSYDGMDDQFLDHQRRSFNNIHEAANFLDAVESPRREDSLMNNSAVAKDSEISIEARSSWKGLPREKHYGIAYRGSNQNDMLQPRNEMQNRSTGREKYQSKEPLLRRDHQVGYENGSISSSVFDEPHDSRMHSSDNFVEHDEDKVKLLRMVYELQEELERSCNLNGKATARVSMGSTQKDTWAPMYHNRQIPQEEGWYDSEYPSYSRRSGPQMNYPGQHSLSRMTSALKAVSGPQVNYYGMEHFPGNIPRSMQLLPSEYWHNRGTHMTHIDRDHYSQYSSCTSSPQHFLSTELSARGIRMQSDHMSHRNNERSYLREKNHLVKHHHLRPIAGGAPFITCNYCLKLLQIPAEFLLVKKRCNQLKCGHCSKVLEFSLQSRTHIVPYVQSAAKPRPYQHNEFNDYALANGKSGSREIDDSIVLSRSSHQELEKELGSKGSENKLESLKKSYRSGDSSSHAYKADKLSSEVGKLSTKSNSPLHRLMGYSSPSQVFRGLDASRRSMRRKY